MEHVSTGTKLRIDVDLVANCAFGRRRNLYTRPGIVVCARPVVALVRLSRRLCRILMTLVSSATLICRSFRWWRVLVLQIRLWRCLLLLLPHNILRKSSLNLSWESQVSEFLGASAHRNETPRSHCVVVRPFQRIAIIRRAIVA